MEVPIELLENKEELEPVELNKKAMGLGINLLDFFKAQAKYNLEQELIKSQQNG
jgi:hypothetical protein